MTKTLYQLQDKVLEAVFRLLAPQLEGCEIILGGGTALARFYLHHRISYDLDFFLSRPFDPIVLGHRLKTSAADLEISGIERGGALASQLHGIIKSGRRGQINISFVEDIFAGMFEVVEVDGIRTEMVDGLYHRKLRTVAGTGTILSQAGRTLGLGHRQTARDLYDLYVLDTNIEPIERFIRRINERGAGFPTDIFRQNLGATAWVELIDECDLLEILSPFPRMAANDLKRHFDDVLARMLKCGL